MLRLVPAVRLRRHASRVLVRPLSGVTPSLESILGVPTGSPRAEVRSRYLAAALRLHPDHNAADPGAADKMMELQDAWQRYKSACRHEDAQLLGGFAAFGVGCSFSDDDEERAARAEVMEAASRGYLHRPKLRDRNTDVDGLCS